MAFEQYLDPVFQGGGGGLGPGNAPGGGLGGGFQGFGQQFRDRLRNRFANRSPNPGLRFRVGLGDVLNRFFPQGRSVRENIQDSFQNAGTTTPSIGVQNQNNPYTGPQVQVPGFPQGIYGHPETADTALGRLGPLPQKYLLPTGLEALKAQRLARAAGSGFAGPLALGGTNNAPQTNLPAWFNPTQIANAKNYQ